MKALFTIMSIVLISWMTSPPPALGIHFETDTSTQSVDIRSADQSDLNPLILATSWKASGSGKYGYYGRRDYGHRSTPHYDRYRHGYGTRHYYGHRHDHFYTPYRFYGGGYYYRPGYYYPPYPGDHFGFSACFRSGSVRFCFSDSYHYPHRYR